MKHAGIWIPLEVLHNKSLTHTERYILMDIVSLDKLDKGCIASNGYFAELLQMKKSHISRTLHSLEKKGYIKIEIEEGSRNHNRVIKMVFQGYQNGISGLPKCEETKETKSMSVSESFYDTGNPTEEQVIEAGKKLNINEEVCTQFYLYYESKKWRGILDFVPLLRKWNMNEKPKDWDKEEGEVEIKW